MRKTMNLSKMTLVFVVLACCCLVMFLTSYAAGEVATNETSVNSNTLVDQSKSGGSEEAMPTDANGSDAVNDQDVADLAVPLVNSTNSSTNTNTQNGGTFGGCDWAIDDTTRTLSITKGTATSEYVSGQLPNGCSKAEDWPWNDKRTDINSVVFGEGVIAGNSLAYIFSGCTNLSNISFSSFDTSNVEIMAEMFGDCSSLTSLSLSDLDTSKVTTMESMFANCSSLTSLDLSKINTPNLTSMSFMFRGCSGLNSLNLSSFDTSNVQFMASAFNGCSGLTSLGLSGFKTSSATSMAYMFNGCSGLTKLDLSMFDTSKVEYISGMFSGCSGLTSIDMSAFNTGATLETTSMFEGCSGLASLDLSMFDTSLLLSSKAMFKSCSKLKTITVDESKWNVENVIYSDDMFLGCTSIVGGAGTTYKDSNPADKTYAHIDSESDPGYLTAISSTAIPLTFTAEEVDSAVTFNWNSGTEVKYSIDRGKDWKDYTAGTEISLVNAGDTVSFKGNNVTTNSDNHFTMSGKIAASGDTTSLTNIIGGDTSLTQYCYYSMFEGCTSLITAPVLPSTILAENCYCDMFNGCTGLTCTPTLPATKLAICCYFEMFSNCTSLKSAPALPATNLANSCYYNMFYGCKALACAPELPATTMAEDCYCGMFDSCTSLTRVPALPATNLANTCYYDMFYGCTGIKLYESGSGDTWSIPAEAAESALTAIDWNADMFIGTGGDFTGWPIPGTVYYYSNTKRIEGYTIEGLEDKTYTGSEIKQNLILRDGKEVLTENTDYTVSYYDNVNVGKATVIITGIGNYTGTKSATFNINAKRIEGCTFGNINDQIYTGNPIEPELVVKDADITLRKGTDYTVAYSNNVEIGTATATITGIGNYTGTQDQTFTIKEAQNNNPSNPYSAQTVSNNSDGSASSKTGDNSIATIAMVLAAVALCAAASAFAGTRKRNRK